MNSTLNTVPSGQAVVPDINQGMATPDATQPLAQETNFDSQQVSQDTVQNVAQDKNVSVKSGKSTMIFIIILFGLVALFIIGLPFLIKLGG